MPNARNRVWDYFTKNLTPKILFYTSYRSRHFARGKTLHKILVTYSTDTASRLQNDILRVEWDVKPHTHTPTDTAISIYQGFI